MFHIFPGFSHYATVFIDNRKITGMKFLGQFFHKISGTQEDNQASIFGCLHLFHGCRGRLNFATLYSRYENNCFVIV